MATRTVPLTLLNLTLTLPLTLNLTARSDLIVDVWSQGGGLGSAASTTFGHYHTNATTDEVVNNIVELLNASSSDSMFANGFPERKL